MKKLSHSLSLLLVIVILFLSACKAGSSGSNATETTILDGATLLDERCTICHPLSRVTAKRLSSDEWKSVVDTMVNRGASLTSDEQTILIDYLATNLGK